MATPTNVFNNLFPRFKAVAYEPTSYSSIHNKGFTTNLQSKFRVAVVGFDLNEICTFASLSEAKSWLYDMLQKYSNVTSFSINIIDKDGSHKKNVVYTSRENESSEIWYIVNNNIKPFIMKLSVECNLIRYTKYYYYSNNKILLTI